MVSVDNRLQKDDTQMGVELNFNKLEDFEPQNIIGQVEPLKKLLDVRSKLSDLRNKITGNDKLEELLDAVVRDTEKLKQISAQNQGKEE
jgi:type VI secretion system protein ImpB